MTIDIVKCIAFAIAISILYGVFGYLNRKKAAVSGRMQSDAQYIVTLPSALKYVYMLIMDAVTELYDRIVNKNLLVRRITISANHIVDESSVVKKDSFEQLNLFVDYEEQQQKQAEEDAALEREKNRQKAMLSIKKKFGKNAILKGMNLEEGATAKERNSQIGGHKA